MEKYITYQQLENKLQQFTLPTRDLPFKSAISACIKKGEYQTHPNTCPKRSQLTTDEFYHAIYQTTIPTTFYLNTHPHKKDSSVIPEHFDIFALKHFFFSNQKPYAHSSFNINFVYRGKATLIFEDETITISEGDLCIIAPKSHYKVVAEDGETIIFDIFIRHSTFNYIFSNTLLTIDSLKEFFYTALFDQNSHANYLLFSSNILTLDTFRELIQNIYIETAYPEEYSNQIAIHLTSLLFFHIVRDFNFKDIYYPLKNNRTDNYYQLILYIQKNYQTITLKKLGEMFNYTPSYISNLIKREFHITFSEYVTNIRMKQAKKLLSNTSYNIYEIADQVGYTSADHFTRTFKKYFHISPSRYRKDL